MTMYALVSLGVFFLACMSLTLEYTGTSGRMIHHMTRSVKRRYFFEGVALYVSQYVIHAPSGAESHVSEYPVPENSIPAHPMREVDPRENSIGERFWKLDYQEHTLNCIVRDDTQSWHVHVKIEGPEFHDTMNWSMKKDATIHYIKHIHPHAERSFSKYKSEDVS